MHVEGNHLSWIVVKDLKSAIQFYTEVVGLKLVEESPEYGWAELKGPEGATLGIAAENPQMDLKAGSNAVMAISVKDIEEARRHFEKKGAKLIGEIEVIPGHVKMQTFEDADGNMMQLAQKLSD